jgi:thioredoxin
MKNSVTFAFSSHLKTILMKKTLLLAMTLLTVALSAQAQGKTDASKVKHLTYKEFIKKVWDFETHPNTFEYKGKLPAVIDFYADWCGPCRKVAPIMEQLAKEYDGKLLVYKINVDNEKELAAAFQVRSIPMVLFIPMKGKPMVQVGAMQEAGYKKVIEEHLIQ